MKNIIISALFFVTIFQSCKEANSSFDVTRIIKNNTNSSINLKVYLEDLVVEEYLIEAQDSLVSNSICGTDINEDFCSLIWTYVGRDSVSLIFDDKKVLTYCGFDENCYYQNDKTIMWFSLYGENEEGYIEVSDNIFVFTITEEDYLLAEEIGG